MRSLFGFRNTKDVATARVQVLGLCRFSLLCLGGFQTDQGSLDARRAALYDSDRLALRFLWFEHICLPSIRAQTDPDFTLILLLGEDFPAPLLNRLHLLVRGVPQIVLVQEPPAQHVPLCKKVMQAQIDPAADVVAQFRLDDDDAVAVDFIAGLRAGWPKLAPMADRDGQVARDYARGLVVWGDATGISLEPRVVACWAPGLALYFPKGATRFLLNYRHHRVWQHMPVVSDPSRIMFLRGAHGTNDSAIPTMAKSEHLSEERAEEVLRRRFDVDLPRFRLALAEHYRR